MLTSIGPYRIVEKIGEGGMGEVYKATDTNLKRSVAIKVLPESVAADAERLARFQREAEVLAALNHPNIAAIYGLERSSPSTGSGQAVLALVMELVEGPTLADRISQGAVPVDEALPIAKQIAEALEAAHEKGIIHRDLKPANIKLRLDGVVKVLDFGLAKALTPDPVVDLSNSPTLSFAATQAGMILGTAGYMSPEQAKGRTVDKRTDVWAFGAVLFEMLTGTRAFAGDDISDTLANVLKIEPDWSRLPAEVSPRVRLALRACLQKDPKQRFGDVQSVRLALEGAFETTAPAGQGQPAPIAAPSLARERLLWVGGALALAALVAAGTYATRPAPVAREMRLHIDRPTGALTQFAISPDGSMVVFQSTAQGTATQLWLRRLDAETAQMLKGTENAARPFWSPDNRAIGFFAGGQLKRLDIADGRIQTVTSAPGGGAGAAWAAEGTILFTRSFAGPLYRVPATGGEATAVTRVDPPRQTGHTYPQFLPDGRHFLFFVFGSPEGAGVYLGSLDSTDVRRLVRNDTAAVFAPPDLVLFAQEGALVARRLNLETSELVGEAVTVAPQVATDAVNGVAALSASGAGPIAYRSQPAKQQLAWFDRSGQRSGVLGQSDTGLGAGRLSPDGRIFALSRKVGANTDVWLMDTTRGTLRRFTVDPGADTGAVWSPDGRRIVFQSDRRAGNFDLYNKAIDGAEPEALLLESTEDKSAMDWSPDGRHILYSQADPKTGRDLWALPLFGDRKPFPVARTPANEPNGRFSPDGRWKAYQSNESGRAEIYVQAFPTPAGKVQVSTDGGTTPQWRGDGRELFYVSPDDRLMGAAVTSRGSVVEAGTPVPLFAKPEGPYAASLDGQRFLLGTTSEEASPITILLNWQPEAKK